MHSFSFSCSGYHPFCVYSLKIIGLYYSSGTGTLVAIYFYVGCDCVLTFLLCTFRRSFWPFDFESSLSVVSFSVFSVTVEQESVFFITISRVVSGAISGHSSGLLALVYGKFLTSPAVLDRVKLGVATTVLLTSSFSSFS